MIWTIIPKLSFSFQRQAPAFFYQLSRFVDSLQFEIIQVNLCHFALMCLSCFDSCCNFSERFNYCPSSSNVPVFGVILDITSREPSFVDPLSITFVFPEMLSSKKNEAVEQKIYCEAPLGFRSATEDERCNSIIPGRDAFYTTVLERGVVLPSIHFSLMSWIFTNSPLSIVSEKLRMTIDDKR